VQVFFFKFDYYNSFGIIKGVPNELHSNLSTIVIVQTFSYQTLFIIITKVTVEVPFPATIIVVEMVVYHHEMTSMRALEALPKYNSCRNMFRVAG
jgi:hypothetical protein